MMFSQQAREMVFSAFLALSGHAPPRELSRLFGERLVPRMASLGREGHSPGSAAAHLLCNSAAFDAPIEMLFPAVDTGERDEAGSSHSGAPRSSAPAPGAVTRARAARQAAASASSSAGTNPAAASGASGGKRPRDEERSEPTEHYKHYVGPIQIYTGTTDGIPSVHARALWWHPLENPRVNSSVPIPDGVAALYRAGPPEA